MPSIMRNGPYRFFFFSVDYREPPHVHVRRDSWEAKFWLRPVRLENRVGFRARELNRIEQIVRKHRDQLLEEWNAHLPL